MKLKGSGVFSFLLLSYIMVVTSFELAIERSLVKLTEKTPDPIR